MTKPKTALLKAIAIFFICFSYQYTYAQTCAGSNGVIEVTNTNDEGIGSLRSAIECANNTAGANTIRFDIPGGYYVIEVGATSGLPLPTLTDPATIIDGRTQNGYLENPLIVLDGSAPNWGNPVNAIGINTDFCEIYGLEIRNFPDDGIELMTAEFCIIKNNYIHHNGSEVDYFTNVPDTGPWEGSGIVVSEGSNQNIIAQNTIEHNEYCGIVFRNDGDDNLIGGPNPEDANSISFNAAGIVVNKNSSSILIQQNSIFCNDTIGIELLENANDFIEAPVITNASINGISGTAPDGMLIEIFLNNNIDCPNAVCQGGLWIASVIAVNGQWSYNPATPGAVPIFGGNVVTATARDGQNNTSEFSPCTVLIGTSACTDQNGNILVTNANDTGNGSLRNAILCANATPGANTILFEIPGNAIHTIRVGSENNEPLPALLDISTIIDGSSQAGFGQNGNFEPRIILDGSHADWDSPINGIWIKESYCEVFALGVINFPDDGIDVSGANFVKIGATNKGNVVYNNGDEIDDWPGAPGTGPWNGCGISFKEDSNYGVAEGNFIGTNYQQTVSPGNELSGLSIEDGGDRHRFSNNIITNHKVGISIEDGGIGNTLSQNSLICNDSIPFDFIGNANLNYPFPTIDSASNLYISGLANAEDIVEVFISSNEDCFAAPCQGSIYLGSATVVDSTWVLTPPFANGVQLRTNDLITTTATNFSGNTSLYSPCQPISIVCDLEVNIGSVSHTTCGLSNGGFTVNLIGGTEPYVLDIGQGPTNDLSFNSLAAGVYNLNVVDDNNCTASITITIDGSISLIASATDINPATCDENNGSFVVNVNSGTPPFLYNIGNGNQNSNLFENLAAGTYTTTVTDDLGCTTTSTVIIDQLGVPQLTVTEQVNATCEQSNGSFSVSATEGLAPYTYDIGNGPQTSPNFNGIAAGTYTVLVNDAANCSSSIEVTIEGSSLPVANPSNIVDASCDLSNGSFEVEVVSGTAPYFFNIGNGNQSNNEFENLSSGTYTVTITDDLGCTTTTSTTINQSGVTELAVFDIGNETCGAANGTFSIAAMGGVPPYTYDIGNGPQSNPEFNGLVAGTYAVLVTDAVGCLNSIVVSLTGSSSPTINVSNIVDASCDQDNGSFNVEVSGGSAPFIFDIGNGTQSSSVFENLNAGIYTVTVSDNLDCTATTDVEITQSGTPQITIENLINETCFQVNGSISIAVSNGLAPYTYDIGNGPQASPDFSGLAAGTYTVVVTDAMNCSANSGFEIINIGQLPTALFTYTDEDGTLTFTNTSQNGDDFLWDFDDGNTTVAANPIYTYEESGDYEVCLTVTNSCGTDTFCESITVDVPLAIINIGGTISKPNGQTVALVEVACTNNPSQVTSNDGSFLFEDQQIGDDFLITPFKDINYRNGVSTYDIYLLNRHILEVEELDSPYKLIAADVDHNEDITTLDLVRLQQLILFAVDTFPNNTSWRFVPTDFVFTDDTDPFLDDFPEDILIENITEETLENDFTAIKVGDVNWSSNPTAFNDPTGETNFNVEKISQEGGTLVLNIQPHNVLDISAFELSLFLENNNLEFESVQAVSGEAPKYFYDKNRNLLNISWYDAKGYGTRASELSFQLTFKYKGGDWQQAIKIADRISARSFDSNGNDTKIALHFEKEKAMNLQVIPNPFRATSQINFNVEKSDKISIRIYDINGILLMNEERYFEKGSNQFEVDLENVSSGIYFLEINGKRGRLVKI